ncbi:hypothetical protein SAMN02982917_0021 [Azospirillum oryzae]|uniref:Uncharacterized protein n=1 Tax=Azospirillum oryzae TaxID=286727 RepID=A0A1X7HRN9_9PROT|nr:hypothetical protein [Azospirillum oryzae]SMF90865.1 hypothetical protein SAMN02982917_0021 [Azospirillum oryzae]
MNQEVSQIGGGYPPKGTEHERLTAELIKLTRAVSANRERFEASGRGSIHDDPTEMRLKGEIQAIGERLDGIGGWGAMITACDEVEDTVGFMGGVVLNYAWDGIGRWAA